jgi:hypothetical protein
MEASMGTQPSLVKPWGRRAAHARSRIVFFLLRRALRRMAVRAGKLAGKRTSVAALAVHRS